jgi:hypothetical protein
MASDGGINAAFDALINGLLEDAIRRQVDDTILNSQSARENSEDRSSNESSRNVHNPHHNSESDVNGDRVELDEEPNLNSNSLRDGKSGSHNASLLSADESDLHIGRLFASIDSALDTHRLYFSNESGVYLTGGSASNQPTQDISHSGVLSITELAKNVNGLSITNGSAENIDSPPASDVPGENTDPRFGDEFGFEVVRWFDPSQSKAHRDVPVGQLLFFNPVKNVTHLQTMESQKFARSPAKSIAADETTLVVSIAGRHRVDVHSPPVWGAYFGHSSPYNIWAAVSSEFPHNIHTADIESLRHALETIYMSFFLIDQDFRTIIIRNSSLWLTRAMTGGLELFLAGHDLP